MLTINHFLPQDEGTRFAPPMKAVRSERSGVPDDAPRLALRVDEPLGAGAEATPLGGGSRCRLGALPGTQFTGEPTEVLGVVLGHADGHTPEEAPHRRLPKFGCRAVLAAVSWPPFQTRSPTDDRAPDGADQPRVASLALPFVAIALLALEGRRWAGADRLGAPGDLGPQHLTAYPRCNICDHVEIATARYGRVGCRTGRAGRPRGRSRQISSERAAPCQRYRKILWGGRRGDGNFVAA
jgi:hypothetical protein